MSVLGSVSSGCSHVKYIYDIAVLFIRMAFSQTIAPLLNDQSKVEEDNSLIEFDSEEFSQPRRLYRCRGNYLNIAGNNAKQPRRHSSGPSLQIQIEPIVLCPQKTTAPQRAS